MEWRSESKLSLDNFPPESWPAMNALLALRTQRDLTGQQALEILHQRLSEILSADLFDELQNELELSDFDYFMNQQMLYLWHPWYAAMSDLSGQFELLLLELTIKTHDLEEAVEVVSTAFRMSDQRKLELRERNASKILATRTELVRVGVNHMVVKHAVETISQIYPMQLAMLETLATESMQAEYAQTVAVILSLYQHMQA